MLRRSLLSLCILAAFGISTAGADEGDPWKELLGVPPQAGGRSLQAAVQAVKEKDYGRFERLLDADPSLLEAEGFGGCPLLCELTLLAWDGLGASPLDNIDIRAIEVALEKGANLATYPDLVNRLLGSANDLAPDEPAYPLESGECSSTRDTLFPFIQRLIRNGALMDQAIQTPTTGGVSSGFFYTYQLCFRVFVCHADHERTDSLVAARVSGTTSTPEREILNQMRFAGLLEDACINSIFR